MFSIWIFDKEDEHKEIPIMKLSALSTPPKNTLQCFKGIIEEMKSNPYRFTVELKARCDVTTRMIESMGVMHNFAKALLFFHEDSTEKNEYLKLFGSFCAMVTSEGATVDD